MSVGVPLMGCLCLRIIHASQLWHTNVDIARSFEILLSFLSAHRKMYYCILFTDTLVLDVATGQKLFTLPKMDGYGRGVLFFEGIFSFWH